MIWMKPVVEASFYKIEIFIPPEHTDALLDALAEAGAGRVGLYERCASVTAVRGTWRPLPGSNPYNGEIGRTEWADEVRVEMNCPRERLAAALAAVRRVHPYEEPLINLIELAAPQV